MYENDKWNTTLNKLSLCTFLHLYDPDPDINLLVLFTQYI